MNKPSNPSIPELAQELHAKEQKHKHHHDEYVIIPPSIPRAEAQPVIDRMKLSPLPLPRLAVYTASKIHHSQLWQQLRMDWSEIDFTARWVDEIGKTLETPENARIFWLQDEEDIINSDVVMIYGSAHSALRGALVEAGMGIALGKRVLVVNANVDSECESFGTWQYHPLCTRVAGLMPAREKLREWAEGKTQLEMW